ncbi:MAG: putative lipid II flippase FtsW [bacterium]|nr:putative lipid II flippase FtsW [bacterium]
MQKYFKKPDLPLFGIILSLIFLGILFLASVSASFGIQKFGNPFIFLQHQIVLGLIPGILSGIVAYIIPISFIKKYAPHALLFTLFLLLLVFVPGIGQQAGGASRWIGIGSLSFQPTELLKLTFILYAASWLSGRTSSVPKTTSKKRASFSENFLAGRETLLPFLVVLGVISTLLLLQPNLSTLSVIGITGIFVYFVASTPVWHTILMVGGGILSLILLIVFEPYRRGRLITFLNPTLDPLGAGYQIKQAIMGIGSGGITGLGLGMSFQKFGVLPEPISDSIFAIIAEELGFIGAGLLVFLFIAFAWRAVILATRTNDTFSRLCAIGIATWISVQAFVNMGAMIGVLPLTGIPLPFISYGGSSLLVTICAMGVLLSVSKDTSHA